VNSHPVTSSVKFRTSVGATPKLSVIAGVAVALTICLPLASVVWLAFFPEENIWPHLVSTVLTRYVMNTVALMAGVAFGTLIIGVGTAWMVTHYEFTGRSHLVWALLLPFAVPAYVIAYVYTDLLEFSGPLQSLLRDIFGWQSARDYYFPRIRSLGGAMCMMILVLYPYVYLLARSAFVEQSASLFEAAKILGKSRRSSFFAISLPMARPAIAIGVAMALMETVNDYGTVDYFAVPTLAAGLFDVWQGMNNLGGAAQISCLILVFVLFLIMLERLSRKHQKLYQPSATRFRQLERTRLTGGANLAAFVLCLLPVVLGFIIPAGVLLDYAIRYFDVSWTPEFRTIAMNSLMLSSIAACVAVSLGIFLSYNARINRSDLLNLCKRLAGSSYALPGAVLAVGVIVPFTLFENTLDQWSRSTFDVSTGQILTGSIFVLVFAYAVRFMAVALGAVESSLEKITPSMDMAARSLGDKPRRMLWRVHIPLMRSGIITALLVVFVDCMKELPATLLLRPFNFDTLATYVYQYASDELLEESALAALMIVATGLIPVLLLSLTLDRGNRLTSRSEE
jgi:iron(III) transport system permease protein